MQASPDVADMYSIKLALLVKCITLCIIRAARGQVVCGNMAKLTCKAAETFQDLSQMSGCCFVISIDKFPNAAVPTEKNVQLSSHHRLRQHVGLSGLHHQRYMVMLL